MRDFAKQIRSGIGRFVCDRAGNVGMIVVLMLIPICGVSALAVEVGNVVSQQRAQQHAADSAALAAATGDDETLRSGVYGYVRDAKAVAFQYPIGDTTNTTVTTVLTDCPGSAAASNDCYKVTISRPFNLYLAALAGKTSMTATAISYARISSKVDLCLISLGSGGITTDGKSTGFGTCYAEALGSGNQKCSSVVFAGLFSPNSPQACNGSPYTQISSSNINPLGGISSKIPSAVSCSADVNNLTFVPIGTTSFARVCSTTTVLSLSGDKTITAPVGTNMAIILDNVSIDTNGHNLTLNGQTGKEGFTIISTNGGGCSSCNLENWFVNNSSGPSKADSTVSIQAPSDSAGGDFDNYAIYDNDDPTKIASATAFNPPNSPAVNVNITGTIYAPMRDLTFNGSVYSSIGVVSNCISILAKSITSNGGKLANNPNSGCAGDGYKVATISTKNVALVQ